MSFVALELVEFAAIGRAAGSPFLQRLAYERCGWLALVIFGGSPF